MDVFVVQHLHELDDESEDVKLIGVYSSEEARKARSSVFVCSLGFDFPPNEELQRTMSSRTLVG